MRAQVYDKSVKGYVFSCNNGRMQLPKDEKRGMHLFQHVVVLQIMLLPDKAFSLELGFTDAGNTRRRLILSSSFNDIKMTPLHCQLPIQQLPRGLWMNIALDMSVLVPRLFQGQTFKTLSHMILGPFCRLRRIFTLRELPRLPRARKAGAVDGDTSCHNENEDRNAGTLPETNSFGIPRSLDFLSSIHHVSHVFTIDDNASGSGGNVTSGASGAKPTAGPKDGAASASMPSLRSQLGLNQQQTTGEIHIQAQDVLPGDLRSAHSSSRGSRQQSSGAPPPGHAKDLPHLAFGRRFNTALSSTKDRSGGSQGATSAPADDICVRGEREVRHTRSTSSEHLLAVSMNSNPSLPVDAGVRGQREFSILESILSTTKISSFRPSVDVEPSSGMLTSAAVSADQMPFTRKILDPLHRNSIDDAKKKERVHRGTERKGASARHARQTLSRSARASTASSSEKKKGSASARQGPHKPQQSTGSSSGNGPMPVVSPRGIRLGMGASAPSNMLGSLPRPNRNAATRPSDDVDTSAASTTGHGSGATDDGLGRQPMNSSATRPFSDHATATSSPRSQASREERKGRSRGVYDRTRYSDAKARKDVRGSAVDLALAASKEASDAVRDVNASDEQSGPLRGEGKPKYHRKELQAARWSVQIEDAPSSPSERDPSTSIPQLRMSRPKAQHRGYAREHAEKQPASSSTSAHLGLASQGDRQTNIMKFEFHSSPRALGAVRSTLEPIAHGTVLENDQDSERTKGNGGRDDNGAEDTSPKEAPEDGTGSTRSRVRSSSGEDSLGAAPTEESSGGGLKFANVPNSLPLQAPLAPSAARLPLSAGERSDGFSGAWNENLSEVGHEEQGTISGRNPSEGVIANAGSSNNFGVHFAADESGDKDINDTDPLSDNCRSDRSHSQRDKPGMDPTSDSADDGGLGLLVEHEKSKSQIQDLRPNSAGHDDCTCHNMYEDTDLNMDYDEHLTNGAMDFGFRYPSIARQ